MTQFFISDLHLEATRPDITDILMKFLQEIAHSEHTLYILGDLFELWIGDDDLTEFNLQIINALKKASEKKLKIFIMHGNRDFLLGKNFFRMTGCELLPDEIVINIAGTPTLLMHGDTLCTQDVKYQQFRKKARNIIFQKLFLWKSLEKRKALAQKGREQSKAHTSTAAEYIMDVTQSEVERVMQKHRVQHLIHGHTHREGVSHFNLNGLSATRTVLGAWHEKGSVLVCDENKKILKELFSSGSEPRA